MLANDKVKILITNESGYPAHLEFLAPYKNLAKSNFGMPDNVFITCVLNTHEYSFFHLFGKKSARIITYKQLLERLMIGYSEMKINYIKNSTPSGNYITEAFMNIVDEILVQKWYKNVANKSVLLNLPYSPHANSIEILIEFK